MRLPSLLPRRRRPTSHLAVEVRAHAIDQPIALAQRDPAVAELSHNPPGFCWFGAWENGRWDWVWDLRPWAHHTHFLPAGVEVLPVRCCGPRPARP